MTKVTIHEIDKMSRKDQDKLLFELIRRGDRGFFRHNLQRFNIPNRTKIYNLGGWSFNLFSEARQQEDSETFWRNRAKEFEEACKPLLDYSSLNDWCNSFLYDNPIRIIQSILAQDFNITSLHIETIYEN